MKLLIITGMSGSGKSKVINYLEDIGYYCVDNLPPKLLMNIADFAVNQEGFSQKVAVTVDTRSRELFTQMAQELDRLAVCGISYQLLFVECEDTTLLKRYKESRRLHPLMDFFDGVDLAQALKEERLMLTDLKQRADFTIDTTLLTNSQLREQLLGIFLSNEQDTMFVNFVAFGYKYGILTDADMVFDVRCLPNPFYIEALREKTGEDKEVRDYVMSSLEAEGIFHRIIDYLDYTIPLYEREGKSQLVVGLGCTGGQHRSVAFACLLKEYFENKGLRVRATGRDVKKNLGEIRERNK